jgi:hypothetical protein
MASPAEAAPAPKRPPPAAPNGSFQAANSRPLTPSRRLFILVALLAVIVLYLVNPATWGTIPGLWAPAAGLGLVVVAWAGPRGGLLLLAAGALTVLQSLIVGACVHGSLDPGGLALSTGDALLGIAEVLAAWQLYRRLGGGRALGDPRSALLFVLIVPGLTAVAFAAARSVLDAAVLGDWTDFWQRLLPFWLSRSLGLLTVAPPLLIVVTPLLVGRGLVRPEAATGM